MLLTARRARANTSSCTSSAKVASLVGTMMLQGTPSLVITTAPSRWSVSHTFPGRAESCREAIIFMLYIYTMNRRASSGSKATSRQERNLAWRLERLGDVRAVDPGSHEITCVYGSPRSLYAGNATENRLQGRYNNSYSSLITCTPKTTTPTSPLHRYTITTNAIKTEEKCSYFKIPPLITKDLQPKVLNSG